MTAPDRITLARRIGSDQHTILAPDETMSHGYVDAVEYVRADVVDELVQAAEQLRALDEDAHEAIVGLQSYRNLRAALARYRGGAE